MRGISTIIFMAFRSQRRRPLVGWSRIMHESWKRDPGRLNRAIAEFNVLMEAERRNERPVLTEAHARGPRGYWFRADGVLYDGYSTEQLARQRLMELMAAGSAQTFTDVEIGD